MIKEDETVGWYHWLNGHEFEQALGAGDGQGSLACCSLWDPKELDTNERLNWTDLMKQICLLADLQKNPLANEGDALSYSTPCGHEKHHHYYHCLSSIQLLSHVWHFVTPWTAAYQASLSITNSLSLPKPMSIESVMPSNHLILWHPLLLLPSIFPSIRVFTNESTLHMRWPKYWSFSFSISPSNEHPGLICFRMDWLDLLAVQRTLKSLFQHHS